MSKRSLFWGQASGKLGEAVYYRAGGEQRTRSYVAKIKNPKTRAQALQRTKFNNMVAVFRVHLCLSSRCSRLRSLHSRLSTHSSREISPCALR